MVSNEAVQYVSPSSSANNPFSAILATLLGWTLPVGGRGAAPPVPVCVAQSVSVIHTWCHSCVVLAT